MPQKFSALLPASPPAKSAFSLVELSIVLVILGLLTGGILTGQSLIRAAELRSVATEFQQYQTAAMTFRDKYFAYPGDMTNATDFWGSLGGGGEGSACFTVESSSTATCNGNGDGYHNEAEGWTTGAWRFGERFHFWKHLANAGLIEGSYTGRTDSTSSVNATTAGKNVPASKLASAVWRAAGGSDVENVSGNYFVGTVTEQTLELRSIVLKPEEAWGIDKKIDDGLPGMGNVFTHKNTSSVQPGCANSDIKSTAEYSLSNDSVLCFLDFRYR